MLPKVRNLCRAITQHRAKSADQSDTDRMLIELEAITDEQAERLLAEESAGV